MTAEEWVPSDGGMRKLRAALSPTAAAATCGRTRPVKPSLVVVMGSVAAKAPLGPSFRVTSGSPVRLLG